MDDRVSIDDDLYLALGIGAIDEEEFSLIMLALDSDEEEEATEPLGPRLNVRSLTTRRCKELFRFTQEQLDKLCLCLRIPAEMKRSIGITIRHDGHAFLRARAIDRKTRNEVQLQYSERERTGKNTRGHEDRRPTVRLAG